MSEEQSKRSWGSPGPKEGVPIEEANAILGEVPNRHVDGESVLGGARADMQEDLESIANLKGKRLRWFVIGLGALVTAAFLLFFAFKPGSGVVGGDVVKDMHGVTFEAPKGWEVKKLEASSGAPNDAKGVALVNPAGHDAVRVMTMDLSKMDATEASDQVKGMCENLSEGLKKAMPDGKFESKAAPIEGLDGCTLRAVGTPKEPIEDLNGGKLPGKTSDVVMIAKGKNGTMVMAFGAHTGETKFADGQVEMSIMNQAKDVLTK